MKETYGSTMIQALKTVLPIQEKMKAKEKRYLCLKISREEAEKLLEELEKTRFKARTRLLRELLKEPRLDVSYASKELGATTSVVKKMTEQGIISIEYEELLRNSLDTEKLRLEEELPLTPEQETAVREILREWEKETPRRRRDRERKDTGLYEADRNRSGSGTTGDHSDPGDCTDISDSEAVLCTVWRKGICDQFQTVSGRTL